MGSIFFTGFPGFLGSALLPRILHRRPAASAVCLVQPRYAGLAARRARALEAADPTLADRIRLVEGDLTVPRLGLAASDELARGTERIYHLAAVYDLEVSREAGMRINVEGTRRVLEFARDCTSLDRLHYVSTCYVSGRFPGTFREADLDVGQSFGNYYEETKYLAEVEVQAGMREGLPATIYRPSIVVGDSDSGATQKFDGPYHLIRLLLKQPGMAVMPLMGDPREIRITVVPRDYLVSAIVHLSGLPGSLGKVYQLADAEPPTVDELVDLLGRATARRVVRVRLPAGLTKAALRRVPLLRTLTGIPPALVDYFTHPTRYATTNAEADLAGSGIRAPPFASYVDRLVAFVRDHPEIDAEAMV